MINYYCKKLIASKQIIITTEFINFLKEENFDFEYSNCKLKINDFIAWCYLNKIKLIIFSSLFLLINQLVSFVIYCLLTLVIAKINSKVLFLKKNKNMFVHGGKIEKS